MDPLVVYSECYQSVDQLAKLGVLSYAAKQQILALLPRLAQAKYDFTARNEDELSVGDGDILLVAAEETRDYLHCLASRNGHKSMGIIPSAYAEILDNPAQHLKPALSQPATISLPDSRSLPLRAPPPHYSAVKRTPSTFAKGGRPPVVQRKVFGVDVDASKAAACSRYTETRDNMTSKAKQLMGKRS